MESDCLELAAELPSPVRSDLKNMTSSSREWKPEEGPSSEEDEYFGWNLSEFNSSWCDRNSLLEIENAKGTDIDKWVHISETKFLTHLDPGAETALPNFFPPFCCCLSKVLPLIQSNAGLLRVLSQLVEPPTPSPWITLVGGLLLSELPSTSPLVSEVGGLGWEAGTVVPKPPLV